MKAHKENKSVFSAIKLLWSVMTTPQKLLCVPLFFALLARSLAMLMPVQCIATVIAKIEGNPVQIFGITLPESWSVEIIAVVSFALIFALWLIGIYAYYGIWRLSGVITNQLNVKALDWTLSPRKNCDLTMSKGEFCYLIKSATDNILNFIEILFISTIPPIVSFVLSVIYIGLIDWLVMLIVLGVSAILILVAYIRVRLDKRLIENNEIVRGKINNLFLNSVTNLPFLSLFKCQIYERKILKKYNNCCYANLKKRTNIQWIYWSVVMLLEYASMAVAVIIANNHTTSNLLSVSAAVLLLGYILRIYDPIERLGYNISTLQQDAIKINRIKLARPSLASLIELTKDKVIIDQIDKIEIRNLGIAQGTFKLDNVNLTFQKGQMVALAGASGAGKTSIVQALLGLREHQNGQIIINDQIEVDSLFFDEDKISYALQEMQLFDRDLAENIFYPDLAKTDAAQHILKTLELDKLLNRDTNSTETMEQKLSGGEKKRVNVARAMIKPAQLYIFDEPTNELDKKNVENVIKILQELSRNAIVIVVSHDARLLEVCDKVFYF